MIFLSGLPSLKFWLDGTGRDYPEKYYFVDHNNCSDYSVPDEALVNFANENRMHLPLHIMVPRSLVRRCSGNVVFEQMPMHLPAKSFMAVSDEICVACPEAAFLLAAKSIPFPLLVEYANDLCANFVTDKTMEFKQRFRPSVSDVLKIRTFLERGKRVDGIKAARRAVKHALDDSNSPVESKLAVLNNIPLSCGGFIAKRPQLNCNIQLPPEINCNNSKNPAMKQK